MSEPTQPEQSPEHTEDQKDHEKEEVPFDPEAKPAKGILVKPGHKREKKSVGGVKVADDAPEKEAGQRKKYDMHKVEGREGVMVRKKSVGALLRPKSTSIDKGDAKDEEKKEDEKDDKDEKEEKKEGSDKVDAKSSKRGDKKKK